MEGPGRWRSRGPALSPAENCTMGIRHQRLHALATVAADPPCPPDLRGAVAAALPRDHPVPQLTWTLAALLHYHRRCRWAADVARERLAAAPPRPAAH